jgi:hypothetical protein
MLVAAAAAVGVPAVSAIWYAGRGKSEVRPDDSTLLDVPPTAASAPEEAASTGLAQLAPASVPEAPSNAEAAAIRARELELERQAARRKAECDQIVVNESVGAATPAMRARFKALGCH